MRRTGGTWAAEAEGYLANINRELAKRGADFRFTIGSSHQENGTKKLDFWLRYTRPEGTRPTDPEYPDGYFRTSSVIGDTRRDVAVYLRGYLEHMYNPDVNR